MTDVKLTSDAFTKDQEEVLAWRLSGLEQKTRTLHETILTFARTVDPLHKTCSNPFQSAPSTAKVAAMRRVLAAAAGLYTADEIKQEAAKATRILMDGSDYAGCARLLEAGGIAYQFRIADCEVCARLSASHHMQPVVQGVHGVIVGERDADMVYTLGIGLTGLIHSRHGKIMAFNESACMLAKEALAAAAVQRDNIVNPDELTAQDLKVNQTLFDTWHDKQRQKRAQLRRSDKLWRNMLIALQDQPGWQQAKLVLRLNPA